MNREFAMTARWRLSRFWRRQEGAISVEWVVLATAVVTLTVAIGATVATQVVAQGEQLSTRMSETSAKTP